MGNRDKGIDLDALDTDTTKDAYESAIAELREIAMNGPKKPQKTTFKYKEYTFEAAPRWSETPDA